MSPIKFLPAVVLLAAALPFAGSAQLSLVSDEERGSFHDPRARASSLNLEQPSSGFTQEHRACATDITQTYPQACFGSYDEATLYIKGERKAKPDGDAGEVTVTPTGSGGTLAQTSAQSNGSGFQLAQVCSVTGCAGGQVEAYYTPGQATCTHAYPFDDYYIQVTAFPVKTMLWSKSPSNCGKVVMYLGTYEPGAGALPCTTTGSGTCGDGRSFNSLSWHNR